MNNIDYIGANELVFNNDKENNIYSGGFNVNSILMKAGMSPIISINNQSGGNNNKVSDIFESLVIPNWALSYNMKGGEYIDKEEESDEELDDDLHDKLLGLVKENQNNILKNKNKKTKKKHLLINKKGGTKRKK